jgi:phosphoribosylanthranilate isomerase
MKVKVCGITQFEQFKQLCELQVDYVGFIFYSKSLRNAGNVRFNTKEIVQWKTNTKIVGVFVNPTADEVKAALILLPIINVLQFHGSETPSFCKQFLNKFTVIKTFSINNNIDLKEIETYNGSCNYFLFDTKAESYGGSGKKFEWSILNNATFQKPFFLSGGISNSDVLEIQKFSNPMFYGIDINSKFEVEPGIKNVPMISSFLKEIKM